MSGDERYVSKCLTNGGAPMRKIKQAIVAGGLRRRKVPSWSLPSIAHVGLHPSRRFEMKTRTIWSAGGSRLAWFGLAALLVLFINLPRAFAVGFSDKFDSEFVGTLPSTWNVVGTGVSNTFLVT